MLKGTDGQGSSSAERRQPATPPEEPEEGEVSDDPGPSTANHDKHSDASDSPRGFAKIPLPFKSRSKAEPRPQQEPRTRVPGSYDRPTGHGIYHAPNAYDRWPPDERDRGYHDYRATHSGYYEYDYRDARYDQSSRYGGADSYVPNYKSNAYDSRHPQPSDHYINDGGEYDRARYRADDRERPVSHSPLPSAPHRLPKRPTPSPPRRGRDDSYRPHSPNLPPGRGRNDSNYDDYARPPGFEHLPPRPRSPHELQDSKSLVPDTDSIPTHYLPRTDGKFRINTKLRVSGGAEHRQVVNQLDPDAEATQPPPPPEEPPAPSPAQDTAPEFVNGVPPPPTDEPPPIPPPLVPRPPEPLPPMLNGSSSSVVPATQSETPKGETSSKGVPVIKVAGTKIMRPLEAELEAYDRIFIGVDKLSEFELLNKLGEGTFGWVAFWHHSLEGFSCGGRPFAVKFTKLETNPRGN